MESLVWVMDQFRLQRMHAQLPRMPIPSAEEIAAKRDAAAQRMRQIKGRVGVLAIHGIIEQRLGIYGALFGGFGTEDGGMALDSLVRAKDVDAILLHIDSPGGTSYGVQELAQQIYDARQKKPVYAIADSSALSAGYWLASQAGNLTVTDGGDVGSIGVYLVHADYSKQIEDEGVKVSIIKAGKYKAEGNPYEPMADATKDYLQAIVDQTYTAFVTDVARGRGVSPSIVREKFGEGRIVLASDARAAGMVDRVQSFAGLLGRLGSGEAVAGRYARERVERRVALSRARD